MDTEILTLQDGQQRLRLVPQLGGGISSWDWQTPQGGLALMRPWDGKSSDPASLACFPLVPWSNRITQGGFAHQGVHYALQNNYAGEPYPIHGDGWLQPWSVESHSAHAAVFRLQSRKHGGNPHEYDAQLRYELLEDGLRLMLKVTHRGRAPLPYGLGLHPCFSCDEATRLQFHARGGWLSGPDAVPIAHTEEFPPGWDFGEPAPPDGAGAIDNCYTGWDGVMRASHPREHLMMVMTMEKNSGTCVLMHPQNGRYFCFEPVSHPIDAFHVKGRPGLVSLAQGESAQIEVTLRVEKMLPAA